MTSEQLLPEEKARRKIDRWLSDAGWTILPREKYSAGVSAAAIEEGLLKGNLEADYLLFLEGKAVGVLEAKRAETNLSDVVAKQAENYSHKLLDWYQYWDNPLPLIYLSNGKELLFKNLKDAEPQYKTLAQMHTPKEMVQIVGIKSYFAGLPTLNHKGLRKCQYDAITNLEASFRNAQTRALIVLATGAGKTFTACMAAYRFLTYTHNLPKRILFLVDRNNLGKQAASAFGKFKLTDNGEAFTTIYQTERLRSGEIPKHADLVICTIQRLYAVITGEEIQNDEEDAESTFEDDNLPAVELNGKMKLSPDFFGLIIVDECHRSIYGRWRKVLEYFKNARIIGLTATPGDETMDFFNQNRVMNYTLEDSFSDGFNVDCRVFRIRTSATENGGKIRKGEKYREITNYTGKKCIIRALEATQYQASDLDRAVINPEQIKLVLESYRKSVYSELYPYRTPDFAYLPKTLIFAKSDAHADNIIKILREQVFPGQCPEFAQKITYSAGDSNVLIQSFQKDRKFRIAVTVTLVATGTDVPPLEVLIFMRDVNSESLYTQMKGRGVRKIEDDSLRSVTPNADSKDLFYLVDTIGVTEHGHSSQDPEPTEEVNPSLEKQLERITHGYLPDELLKLLAMRLNRIHTKSTEMQRMEFARLAGMDMKKISDNMYEAIANGSLAAHPFQDARQPNELRKALVQPLSMHEKAREKLLTLNAGFLKILQPGRDKLISADFSKEKAKETTDQFEEYVQTHRDEEEALRIIANNTGEPITYAMLEDLKRKFLEANSLFSIANLWHSYKVLNQNMVTPFKDKTEQEALTNLIQLVRFALKTIPKLYSLVSLAKSRFALWCGQHQREPLSETQRYIAQEITNYIVSNGYGSRTAFAERNKTLLIQAKKIFGSMEKVDQMILSLSSFMLALKIKGEIL